jgi:hypothetical protein
MTVTKDGLKCLSFEHKESLKAYLMNLQRDPTIWTILNTVAENKALSIYFKKMDLTFGGGALSQAMKDMNIFIEMCKRSN